MQIGINVERRVARMDAQKANRLRTVESIPDVAEDGDMVLFEKQLHVYSRGAWRNIDDALQAQVKSLDERLTALEDNDE